MKIPPSLPPLNVPQTLLPVTAEGEILTICADVVGVGLLAIAGWYYIAVVGGWVGGNFLDLSPPHHHIKNDLRHRSPPT